MYLFKFEEKDKCICAVHRMLGQMENLKYPIKFKYWFSSTVGACLPSPATEVWDLPCGRTLQLNAHAGGGVLGVAGAMRGCVRACAFVCERVVRRVWV